MFPWEYVDGPWAMKSEGVGLIIHPISFQDFQPMWSWSTNVTDVQTTCNRKTALCTIVHCVVINMETNVTANISAKIYSKKENVQNLYNITEHLDNNYLTVW